jgi:hypothetical protein
MSALLGKNFARVGLLPHGMCTAHPDTINPDVLAFIQA